MYETSTNPTFDRRKTYEIPNLRFVKAPIPGTCISVEVVQGQKVKQGDIVVMFNAMKMHNRVVAPIDGVIKSISVVAGQVFKKGTVLVEIA